MKKLIGVLTFVIVSKGVVAQFPFQSINYGQAIEQAGATNKMVFVQFESVSCIQCNEVANKAFENKELADLMNETFVCVKITSPHPDRYQLSKILTTKNSFGSFIFDRNGTLIHTYNVSTTLAKSYKEQIEIALTKASEGVRISELESEYSKNQNDINLVQALLLKRKSLNLQTDLLLTKYINLVHPDSVATLSVLVFVAKMTPVFNSAACQFLRKNNDAFNTAWYSMPLAERLEINSTIVSKSMNKAIKEKNETYAYEVAGFNKSTYTSNFQAAEKAFDKNLVDYYFAVKDTFNYLLKAANYYDKYYMTVLVENILNQDSLLKSKLLANAKADTVSKTANGYKITKSFSFSPQSQMFTLALNTGAWNFYKTTNNPNYTIKALQWAKHAIEFYESAEAMDTYARLLYKTGNQNEAVIWEQKAIALKQKRGLPTADFEAIINKMKAGAEKID